LYRRPRSALEKSRDFFRELTQALGYEFSAPVPTAFDWYTGGGGTTLNLNGLSVSTAVPVEDDYSRLNDIARAIGRYLEERDFIISDANVTEIVTGHEQGFYRVLIRTRADEDAPASGRAFVDVICGVAGE
jgi:hypothetical protein